MRRVLSIGGKCEGCGGHIELRVASFIDVYKYQFVHYVIGFIAGVVGTYLTLR